ncbi:MULTISPECIES: glycosyltransferase family 9 protein [Fusobacterium]|uniref:glycosyltransferase family 9 protein n=1 Tax=Fusobacterium TaxID=848 RepID=UPI0014771C56|nr:MULTISPECIES: glycosyltransferase family 9 protein [Fusobacterium]NME35779.1 glycosyltransferase family 9 protein [Fusobacterium sp. FSA-380-WT-3A]
MKILVVRFKQMGDAILATPVCNTLRKTFPDAEIDFVCYEHVAPIFKEDKNFNTITITNKVKNNAFRYLWEVYKITRKKYDIVIDFVSTPKSEWFTFLSGAKYRIGRYNKKRGFTYTHKIKEPTEFKNEVEKGLMLLEPLEKEYNIKYDTNFSLYVTDEEKEKLRKQMVEKGIDFSKPIVALSATAKYEFKVYPIDSMVKTIELILEKNKDIQFICFGTPDQKEYIEKFYKKLNYNKNIFTNIETKSVRDLLALLSNCHMYFGNEGGARHMAQGLDIPSFAVFWPESDTKCWIPFGGERHRGIISKDIQEDYGDLSWEEIFNLITPERLVEEFYITFDKFVERDNIIR